MDIKGWLNNQTVRRFAILVLFCLLLYSAKSMMNLVLLTFIFTFLMGRIHEITHRQLNRFLHISPKVILPFLYLLLIFIMVFGILKLFPVVRDQIIQLIKFIVSAYDQPKDNEYSSYIVSILNSLDLKSYIKPSIDLVMRLSNIGLNLFLAVILSLFFLLEKTKVTRFSEQFRTSKISWFTNEIEYFGKKFVQTFGKVIETQLMIALINCILTTLGLWIMGFPQIIGLALIIFVLGLIPVAGAFISLIPLCLIGLNIGGLPYVIYVIIMIAVIHAIEAYFLNPKLMSSKIHLPIFFTFLILLFSEHYLGVWGLIIGIPIVIFLLDILGVQTQVDPDRSNKS
ncbi:AI-2E family transporter [Paenibacillus sp. GCM10027626]|uniref:AI-2E family transporter n=1 Tax=Paenibacillus sp. GCM10027626 TaxID=3273411 RepID=UPI00362AB3AF